MNSYKLLLVDDEETFIKVLQDRLERKGYQVTAYSSSVEAMDLVKGDSFDFDVALLDIMMGQIDGIELLEAIKKYHSNTEVVMLTGFSTVESAIDAMKKGAYDYLTKPIKPVELELVLQKAAEKKHLVDHNQKLIETNLHIKNEMNIIGESKAIVDLRELIARAADSPLPALILGESGTGKDLVANALHYQSSRSDQTFVPINVAAIPEQLIESELFGHVKGAFTGAHTNKKGLVELAQGGTLFLDEIGDMDLGLQSKLLRFLDSGEYRPVGATAIKKASLRIVAATNIDLAEKISLGEFREDLYYRLSVITINMPPLRDREDDALVLARHIIGQRLGQKQKKELSQDAIDFIRAYKFPGNVRELINLIERGIVFSRDVYIRKSDMILQASCDDKKIYSLQDLEKEHIKKILAETSWDKPQAAELLQIGLRTLYRKIKEYELE